MARGFIDTVTKDLAALVKAAHPYLFGEKTFGIPASTPQKVWYWLDETQSQQYDHVVRRVLNHKSWSLKFSEQYVRWAVKRIFDHALDNGIEQIGPSLARLAAEFEAYATEHMAIVPIQGLRLGLDELKIGNVLLKPLTDEYAAHLDKTHHMTPVYGLRGMAVKVCAEYTVIAEQGKAADRAEDECRRSIDVLRYWISFCTREGSPLSVGLFPESTGCEANLRTPGAGPY